MGLRYKERAKNESEMAMLNLVIAGCSGHAFTCRSLVNPSDFNFSGYMLGNDSDVPPDLGETVFFDSQIPQLVEEGFVFHCGIGHIKSVTSRKKVMSLITASNGQLVNLVSSTSCIFSSVRKLQGLTICANTYIGPGASIGFGSIINTGAIVEHGVNVGPYCHVSTGAILNGDAEVGSETFIGSGVVVKEGTRIGSNVIIQAGSFVRKDVPSGEVILNL